MTTLKLMLDICLLHIIHVRYVGPIPVLTLLIGIAVAAYKRIFNDHSKTGIFETAHVTFEMRRVMCVHA